MVRDFTLGQIIVCSAVSLRAFRAGSCLGESPRENQNDQHDIGRSSSCGVHWADKTVASADTPAYYPPQPHGTFVDNPDPYDPYYKPDECYFDLEPYFDYKAGYNVKFDKKVIKYYDPYAYKYVEVTIIKAKCKIASYPSKKKIVFKGFGCDIEDKHTTTQPKALFTPTTPSSSSTRRPSSGL